MGERREEIDIWPIKEQSITYYILSIKNYGKIEIVAKCGGDKGFPTARHLTSNRWANNRI